MKRKEIPFCAAQQGVHNTVAGIPSFSITSWLFFAKGEGET